MVEVFKNTPDLISSGLRSSKSAIFHLNLDENTFLWSSYAADMLGLDESQLKVSFEDFLSLIHPDDRRVIDATLSRHAQGQKPFAINLRLRHKTQSYNLVRAKGEIAVDAKTGQKYVTGQVIDINDQVHDHRNLVLLQEMTGIGFWRYDIVNDTLFWSEKVFEIYGLDPTFDFPSFEEALSYYHPEDRHIVENAIMEVQKTCTPREFEARLIRHDKKEIITRSEAFCECGEDDTPKLIWGVFEDITKKKEEENQRKIINMVAEHTSDSVIVTDAKDRIEWVNNAFENMTGYTLEQVKGQKPGHIFQGPETDPETVKKLSKAIRNREPITTTILNYDKQGNKYWLSININPVFDERGELIKFIAIQRDITQEQENQQELQRYREDLERIVEEKTADLAKAKEAAEKANMAKNEFLARMSHELRTPLNSIIGLTSILEESDMSGKQQKSHQTIRESSNFLLNLVNDILDIAKIEAGLISIEEKPFCPRDLLTSIKSQISPLARRRDLKFTDNIDDLESTLILGDAHHIHQVITNLLGNALKYTLQGEIRLEAALHDEDDGGVEFEVKVIDSGIGIPKDKQHKVFDSFTQVDESTTREFEGSGLGLNIVKNLVEEMNGTVSLESEENKGSVFTIRLLLRRCEQNIDDNLLPEIYYQPRADHIVRPSISQAHVLVAEDNAFNKIFVKELLDKFGCQNAHFVDNGEQAVAFVKRNNVDLILMDCRMPKLNGYEATRQIRQIEKKEKRDKRATIVAMTADVMRGTKFKCLSAGMDDYIPKPLTMKTFRGYLDTWIDFNGIPKANYSRHGSAEDLLDLTILREYVEDDPEKLKHLLGSFVTTATQDINTLKESLDDKNPESWQRVAHRLKGSASYIGAEQFHDLCRQAQFEADGNALKRRQLYADILEQYNILCDYLVEKDLLDEGIRKERHS